MYTVVIVDDEPWALQGLAEIIDWNNEGFSIIGQFTDPDEAFEFLCKKEPDVVFTDIRMPGLSGLDLIEMSRVKGLNCEFVLISSYEDFEAAQKGIRLHVWEYILKPYNAEDIHSVTKILSLHLEKRNDLVSVEYRYLRCQMGTYGGQMGKGKQRVISPENSKPGAYYDPNQYCAGVVKLFSHLRDKLGYEVELLHDIHERLTPAQAIGLAKKLEPYQLFFLEDALSPEQMGWFSHFRNQTAVPLAMGELFNNPIEWNELISKRLIDYIRVHVSQIGGLTPARKLAALCENFGVRTAWHGPGDLSPVGVVAQLHLDLAIPNFGIQEFSGFSPEEEEVFPGCPQVRNGYLYANDKPGFGIDIDEKKAAMYPCSYREPGWLLARTTDGTAVRP